MSLAEPQLVHFDVNGTERSALVVAPEESKAPHPVIFCYHGHGGAAKNAAATFDLFKLWPEAICVYPQGLPTKTFRDPAGTGNGWQTNDSGGSNRDLDMFDTMLAKLKVRYTIDEKRLYVMGHSNGGGMTYYLWHKRGDLLAAIGPSASSGGGYRKDGPLISIFHQGGTRDQIVPFSSQEAQIERLKKNLGVAAPGTTEGSLTTFEGSGGVELATYITNGTHSYDRKANELLVAFFKRHSRQ